MRPPPFTLRQLQYLVTLAETRSFHRAAERCHVSQPSLSAQVAEVEAALGLRVFERDRRRVLITKAGEPLLERARQLLLDADQLADAAARLGDPLAGTLRVGVIPTVSPYLLPEIAAPLRRALPRLGVSFHEDKTAALVAQLQSGGLDAALLALEAELGDVESEVIARDEFVLAASPRHPLARDPRRLSQSQLPVGELLLLGEGHCLRDQAIQACGRRGRETSPFGATSLATLVQMVAAGEGVTLLPELALPVENRRRQLRVRRFVAPAPGRTLAMVWRTGSPVAPAAKRVAEIVRDRLD
jgi:LysR family hydrogen peroxide-inducible transcriptional activator